MPVFLNGMVITQGTYLHLEALNSNSKEKKKVIVIISILDLIFFLSLVATEAGRGQLELL